MNLPNYLNIQKEPRFHLCLQKLATLELESLIEGLFGLLICLETIFEVSVFQLIQLKFLFSVFNEEYK